MFTKENSYDGQCKLIVNIKKWFDIATMLLPQLKSIFGHVLAIFFLHIRLSGNPANAFSSDLNSICRNEVQTSRFEDAKRGR